MQWPSPRAFEVDIDAGHLRDSGSRYEKRLRDLAGSYADEAAFEVLAAARGDEVVYDVTDYKPNANPGDLILGVTRMSPGKVGHEYFMTRGHIHARIDRPELYFGLKGRGLMLMESPDGQTQTLEVLPNVACYVPPRWIHRSINTGGEDLVMLFCYPADSGQDYDIIAQSNGMKLRIVDDGAGGWRSVENPAYLPRSAAAIEALLLGALA